MVVGVLLALMASACSGSSDLVDQDDGADTSDTPSEETVSLGTRESGFGPGSLVRVASEVANRLESLRSSASGDWIPVPPYEYEPRPSACGVAEPTALGGLVASRQSQADAPFGESIAVEVSIYPDAEAAANEVAALNGSDAVACDIESAERAMEDFAGPDGIPGVEFDLGDGVGAEIAVPFEIAGVSDNAAARAFEGQAAIGAEERVLEQVEWVAADGRYVVHVASVSTTGAATDVAIEAAEILFAEPLPAVERDEVFDDAVDIARGAVLPEESFPAFYDESNTLRLVVLEQEGCLATSQPETVASGPSWLNITPGVGSSEVLQGTLIFSTPDEATAFFDDVVEGGTDCFVELIDLPQPMFTFVDGSSSTTMVDGYELLLLELDYTQAINTAEFDVEFDMAAVRVGELVFSMRFSGLAGDSPDLAALVIEAVERSGR